VATTRFPKDDVPDELWKLVEPLIPVEPEKLYGGRPPLPSRALFAQVVYRLRTGCPWKALPNGSTVHRRFGEWVEQDVFRELWKKLIERYDAEQGVGLDWTSMDSASVKAPKGGTSVTS